MAQGDKMGAENQDIDPDDGFYSGFAPSSLRPKEPVVVPEDNGDPYFSGFAPKLATAGTVNPAGGGEAKPDDEAYAQLAPSTSLSAAAGGGPRLGRVLSSKAMRRDAESKDDQVQAALAEIDEIEDPAEKKVAVSNLLSSIGGGKLTPEMAREVMRRRREASGKKAGLPDMEDMTPDLAREMAGLASEDPENKPELPEGERASLRKAVDLFGGVSQPAAEDRDMHTRMARAIPEGLRTNSTSADFNASEKPVVDEVPRAYTDDEAKLAADLGGDVTFMGTVKEGISNPEAMPFAGGIIQIRKLLQYGKAMERLRDSANYPLRDKDPRYAADMRVVTDKENEDLVESFRAEKGGWKYLAGNIAVGSLTFAGEMGLTSGAYTIPKQAVKKAILREMADQSFNQIKKHGTASAIKYGLAETAGWAAGSVAQTAANPHRIAIPAIERRNAGESLGKAVGKGAWDAFREVSSEHVGGAIDAGGKALLRGAGAGGRALKRSRFLSAIERKTTWTAKELDNLTNIARGGGSSADMAVFRSALEKAPDGTFKGPASLMPAKLKESIGAGLRAEAEKTAGRVGWKKAASVISERFGINSILGEVGEEFAGGTMGALAGTNDEDKGRLEQLKDVWTPSGEEMAGMVVGFLPMSLLGHAASGIGRISGKEKFRKAQAEQISAWKAKDGTGEAPTRRWLDRYAVAQSPEEWQGVEKEQLAETREAWAKEAEAEGAPKEHVEAIRAAEDFAGLESAWKTSFAPRLEAKKTAAAADVREKGLGEDLAKRFEAAKTAEEFNAAATDRFKAMRDRRADELEQSGLKDAAASMRKAEDAAGFDAAAAAGRIESIRMAADEMEASGYLPDETADVRSAKTAEEFKTGLDSARLARSRRELAEEVSKAPGVPAERLDGILRAENPAAVEAERFKAFQDYALPGLLKVAGLPDGLSAGIKADGFDGLRVKLAEAIGEEMQAPASGLPSYLAEAILSGDAELAAYFGALRQMRMEEWKQALAENMARWAVTPETQAILGGIRQAKDEKTLSGLVSQAEAFRAQAQKGGLAGAAVALATDAAGAEDVAARVVEAMASGRISAQVAIRSLSGTGDLPAMPQDPMPPLESNPLWKSLARPDATDEARQIAESNAPAIEKLAMLNDARKRIGLPDLSGEASAAFFAAVRAGTMGPQMVLQAIRTEEKARRRANAAPGASKPSAEAVEGQDRPAETPEDVASRRGAEITAMGGTAEETIARLEAELEASGRPAPGAADRAAAMQALRDGTFTAEDAAAMLLGKPPASRNAPEHAKKRRPFMRPVSERQAEDGKKTDEPKEKPTARVKLRTPQGNMIVEGTLRVVDLFDDVVSSYDDGYEVKALQNRALDGLGIEDAEPRVDKIVKEFDHRELLSSTTSESGPPVVKRLTAGKKLNVLSGNGRTKALRKLHKLGRLGRYIASVREIAAERGIEIPEGVRVPVLAIELDEGYDLEKFVYLSNKDKIDGFNAYEKALNDADVILREGLLDKFTPGEDGQILTEENRDFWVSLIDAVGERKQLLDSDNRPDDSLEPRIRRAILAALFKGRAGGKETVQALVERSKDLGARAQITAIMAAAGPVLKVAKEKPGFSIADEFAEAVEMFLDYKANEGAKIRKKTDMFRAAEKYLASPRMFQKERGAVQKTIFRILATSSSIKTIRERFAAYAQSVAAIDTTTNDLFGANDAAGTAARDRAEKIKRLEMALGVQVEEEAGGRPSTRIAMRKVSERSMDAEESYRKAYRTILDEEADVVLDPAKFGLSRNMATRIEMEVEAEGSEEAEMEPDHDGLDIDGEGLDLIESPHVHENLVRGYQNLLDWDAGNRPGQYASREDIIGNLRASLFDVGKGKEAELTDEQVVEIAQDSWERRVQLHGRIKSKHRPLMRSVSERKQQEPSGEFRVLSAKETPSMRDPLRIRYSTKIRFPDGSVSYYSLSRDDALRSAKADYAAEQAEKAAYAARPTAAQGRAMAERIGERLAAGEKIHFADDFENLPEKIRMRLARDRNFGKGTKAFTMPDGAIWVLAKRHRDMNDLAESILHEDLESIMVHLMGSDGFAEKLDQAFQAAGLTAAYRKELRNIVISYDYVEDAAVREAAAAELPGWEDAVVEHLAENADARREVMRELLAHVRQRRASETASQQDKGMWDAIVEAIREFLSEVFGVVLDADGFKRSVPEIEILIDELASRQKPAKPKADGTLFRNDAETAYESRFGNVLNVDNAKIITGAGDYDPSNPESVVKHYRAGAELVDKLFGKWLSSKKNTGDGTVTFTGGGNGAGKSTVAKSFGGSDFVFDSTMVSKDSIRAKIAAVIANGQVPRIVYVHRDPARAWIGVKNRVDGGGHVVPVKTFANTHAKAREAFMELMAEFGGKVEAVAYDNTVPGESRIISMDELRALPEYDSVLIKQEIERYEREAAEELGRVQAEGAGGPETGQRGLSGVQGLEASASGLEENGAQKGFGEVDGRRPAFRNEDALESERRLRDSMSDEQARKHLESKGVRETPEAVRAVQLQIEGILGAEDVPLSGDERKPVRDAGIRAKGGKIDSALIRRDQARKLLRALANPSGKDSIAPSEAKAIFDESPNVSAIIPEFYGGEQVAWPIRGMKIRSPRDIAALAMPLRSPYQESLKVAFVDAKMRVIDARVVTLGILNSSLADMRVVFGSVPDGTQGVFIAHNHPSGDPTPSSDDIQTTRRMQAAARLIGVNVVDHIITNGSKYYSLRESGLMAFTGEAPNVAVPKGMSKIERVAPEYAPSQAEWEAIPLDQTIKLSDPSQVQRIAGWLRQGDPDADYAFLVNTKNGIVGVSRFRSDGMVLSNMELGKDLAAVALRHKGAVALIVDFSKIPADYSSSHQLLVDRIKIPLAEAGVDLLDVISHEGGTMKSMRESGEADFTSRKTILREGRATFRNETDGTGSVEDSAKKAEARFAGHMQAQKENISSALALRARIIRKIWPSKGESVGVDAAQDALRAELKKLKPTAERKKDVDYLIDALRLKDGASMRTGVMDVLAELDALAGFDAAVSDAVEDLMDREWVEEVLDIVDVDPAEAEAAAKKLKWAAPIYRKGVKAGYQVAEKESMLAVFLARHKAMKKTTARGKFEIEPQLISDLMALTDGMDSVHKAAKEETRLNRAKSTLRLVLGKDAMERLGGLAERDPVEALRLALSIARSLVFEAHSARIMDALGSKMLLSDRDVSYFVHNLEAPKLDDMAFSRIHPSVKPELRELLGGLPWQSIFGLKALEHARKRAEDLGGEYDGMKADRIAALMDKQRKKILAWMEGMEPMWLVSAQIKLKGLLGLSLSAQAAVLAGRAKEMHDNAAAIAREAEENMDEISGQKNRRARNMRGLFYRDRLAAHHSTPETLALMLAGGDVNSMVYRVLNNDLREGSQKADQAFMRQIKALEKWYKDNGIGEDLRRSWRGEIKEWTIQIQGADLSKAPTVVKLMLSESEMMDLYAHLQDEETLVDVARGAKLNAVRQKTTSTGASLPAKELAYGFRKAVGAALTAEQRKVAEHLVAVVTAMGGQINAMSRMLEGKDIAYSTRFWERQRDFGDTDPEEVKVGHGEKTGKLATSGHTKERVSNRRGIFIKDIFDHFDAQLKWASSYSQFALAQKMALAALSWRSERKAKSENETDEVLDLRNTIARRIGDDNLKHIEFSILRVSGKANLTDDWGRTKYFISSMYRRISASKLGLRLTSILNNGFGGSIMLASRMAFLDGFTELDYWTARSAVASPLANADAEIKAIREAILENAYFWKRIVYNRYAIQSQHLYEGGYDKSKKRLGDKMERFVSAALAGMSAQELHNAMACVLALQKKGWSIPKAVAWTQTATELTQNPSNPLDETNAYVWVKKNAADMLFPFFGQVSVEANLFRREGIILDGIKRRLKAATEKANAAHAKMDVAGEARWKAKVEQLKIEKSKQMWNYSRTIAAIGTAAAYSAIQNAVISYLKQGKIPLVSKEFWLMVLKMMGIDSLSRFSPLASGQLYKQARELLRIGKAIWNDKKVGRSDLGKPDVILLQTLQRILYAINDLQSGNTKDGVISLAGSGAELIGAPVGGAEQIMGVAAGVYEGIDEGWKTDLRKPVSQRGKKP